MSARCPTCGRSVPSVFEHVDVACETWGDRGTPEGDAAEAAYKAAQAKWLQGPARMLRVASDYDCITKSKEQEKE